MADTWIQTRVLQGLKRHSANCDTTTVQKDRIVDKQRLCLSILRYIWNDGELGRQFFRPFKPHFSTYKAI